MFEFLRRKLCFFIYGREFKVSAQQVLRYKQVRLDLDSIIIQLCDGNSGTFHVFKGVERNFIEKNLPPEYRFTDTNLSEKNYILPQIATKFFLEGHTLDEISSYECIKRYGMLHGKKRYLRII